SAVAEVVFAAGRSDRDVVDLCANADVLVGSIHLDEVLSANPSVRLVQVPAAGVDSESEIVMRHAGVRLTNSHANAHVTAQFAVAMLLALLNRLVPGHEIVRLGRWDDRWLPPPPTNMSDMTVGVLGAGRVGTEIARLLRPFTQSVVGLKKRSGRGESRMFDRMAGLDELDQFLDHIDILFLAVPLTASTRNLITKRELAILGETGFLVNVARGEVVNERDLFHALRNGNIRGAAIEVWYDYNPMPDSRGRRYPYSEACPFHELENVLLSPHRAGWTEPAPDYWEDIIENVRRVAAGNDELLNEVNVEAGY
ncbi:MAG: NAD(P)-dependent oxidoreductase, partial [Rhodothermales bacterium]|nr:NAD(P)-dependent oxidoreductase [Rhodothermales bacterium]